MSCHWWLTELTRIWNPSWDPPHIAISGLRADHRPQHSVLWVPRFPSHPSPQDREYSFLRRKTSFSAKELRLASVALGPGLSHQVALPSQAEETGEGCSIRGRRTIFRMRFPGQTVVLHKFDLFLLCDFSFFLALSSNLIFKDNG